MNDHKQLAYQQALQDFRRARDRANLELILERLQGQPTDLFSYDEVRRKLRARSTAPRGLQEIPLNSIVGSVGRYGDFTRTFLPLDSSDHERWARVKALAEGLEGLPPIDVYQIGEVYFVRDGHHRVSVAREIGAKTIEAYVTEVKARVPLSPSDDPRRLILKEEYTEFLEATELDQIRPEADLTLTEPGKYRELRAQIDLHRQFLEAESSGEVEYQRAVADWHDRVYQPVVRVIRRQGILREFPERTEADLYLWIMEHREALAKHLGWEVNADQAAADLAEQHTRRAGRRVEQIGGRLLRAIIPDELESGPPTGDWRRRVVSRRLDDKLFRDILVAVRDDEQGWRTLEQAIQLAKLDGGRILGLHVASEQHIFTKNKPDQLAERFRERCQQAAVESRFVIDRGKVNDVICRRARWADVVILSLKHPPAEGRLARLGSGLRKLIRSCPRPLLLLPEEAQKPDRLLVAYDGSPKAQEALFIATYMCSAWSSQMLVLTVEENGIEASAIQREVDQYLQEKDASAELESTEGKPAEVILRAAQRWGANLILIGGYGASPVVEAVLGSTVDQVLRQSDIPILVCR